MTGTTSSLPVRHPRGSLAGAWGIERSRDDERTHEELVTLGDKLDRPTPTAPETAPVYPPHRPPADDVQTTSEPGRTPALRYAPGRDRRVRRSGAGTRSARGRTRRPTRVPARGRQVDEVIPSNREVDPERHVSPGLRLKPGGHVQPSAVSPPELLDLVAPGGARQ